MALHLHYTMLLVALVAACSAHRPSEVWTREQEDAAGIVREHVVNPLPKVSAFVLLCVLV